MAFGDYVMIPNRTRLKHQDKASKFQIKIMVALHRLMNSNSLELLMQHHHWTYWPIQKSEKTNLCT